MNKGLVLAFAAGLLTGGLAVYFFMQKKYKAAGIHILETDEYNPELDKGLVNLEKTDEMKEFEEEHLYDAGAPNEEQTPDPTADACCHGCDFYASPVFDINGNPYQRVVDTCGYNTGFIYGHSPKPFIENTHISGDDTLINHKMWELPWYLGKTVEIGDIWENQGTYEALDDYDRFEYIYAPGEGVLYTVLSTLWGDNEAISYRVEAADDERNLFGFVFEVPFKEPTCDYIYLSNEKSFIAKIHVRELFSYERPED